jgi:glucose 1-dehydrogenase
MNSRAEHDFAGSVIAVTGAAQGLGREVVRILSARGAAVAVIDRNREGAQETVDELVSAGGTASAIACDVADAASVEAAVAATVEALGGCDGLVNNAGILPKRLLQDETVEGWDETLAINLRGPFLCTQRFGRLFRDNGRGTIVNIASIGGTVPTLGAAAYCASKAGILALTRQTALEWGEFGIRTNAVSPGYMDTPMTADRYRDAGMREQRASIVPLGRIAHPSEVAQAVAFLLSEDAGYINGHEIVVDGGFLQSTTRRMPQPAQA